MFNEEQVAQRMLLAGVLVAGMGGVIALISFLLAWRGRKQLFSGVGPPRSRWNGFGVLGSFVIFAMFTQLVQAILVKLGFFAKIYGPDFPTTLPLEPSPAELAASAVRFLWSGLVAFVFQVGLIISIVRRQGGPNPLQLRSAGMNIVSGYLTWLLVTPAAYSVFVVVSILHTSLTGKVPDKHPLTLLGDRGGSWEWTLFIMQTVFFAPVLEELVFRGVLLPWLARHRLPKEPNQYTVHPRMRSDVVLLLAFAVAAMLHIDDWMKALAHNDLRNAIGSMIPGIFFLSIVPLYWLLPRYLWLRKHLRVRSAQQVRAIVASSALFAAFHATVWPSPIPLFVLAMGLGYLAVRTRSLVGPMLVHALFNAIGALYLVMGGRV